MEIHVYYLKLDLRLKYQILDLLAAPLILFKVLVHVVLIHLYSVLTFILKGNIVSKFKCEIKGYFSFWFLISVKRI